MVAEAAAQAETAALVGEHTIDRNIRHGRVRRQEITAEQVAWSRRNASYATQLAHSAVKLIFEAAGGTALYASNPLQEIFRDIIAASAHLSLTLAPRRAAAMGRSASACRSISTRFSAACDNVMSWLVFALCGPILWAISVHLDKYLVERYFKDADVIVLLIFTALMGVVLMPVIAWFEPGVFHRDWTAWC